MLKWNNSKYILKKFKIKISLLCYYISVTFIDLRTRNTLMS